jgi:hypothetical protein
MSMVEDESAIKYGGEGLCGCTDCFCLLYIDCDCSCCCYSDEDEDDWEAIEETGEATAK